MTTAPDKEQITWCDGCLNHRPCRTRSSGLTFGGKEQLVQLCRWCRGVETRQRRERERNERRTAELLTEFAEEMKNVRFVPGKGFVRTRR